MARKWYEPCESEKGQKWQESGIGPSHPLSEAYVEGQKWVFRPPQGLTFGIWTPEDDS